MFDVNAKIQEYKELLEKSKADKINQKEPKWWQTFQEMFYSYYIEKLEAIKNKRFHVTISLKVDCEHFDSKEFPIAEFDLTDEQTVKCAMLEFKE